MRRRGSSPDLPARLVALRDAAELAEHRLDAEPVGRARFVIDKADARLVHGTEHTVAALAGATGSGKSSLFNALCGAEISSTSARRPTTGEPHACVFGTEHDANRLLDWMEVDRRHQLGGPPSPLDGLVLIDLPDHDSVRLENRLEMERVAELVDLLIWVTDPEKYADAALHGYLRRYAGHDDTTVVAVNKVDRLQPDEAEACRLDLLRLLTDDGLPDVDVASVSATTGAGIDQLRDRLGVTVAAREAAVDRLTLEVIEAADGLAIDTGSGAAKSLSRQDRKRVISALGDAAGVPVVTDAVGGAYRREAALRTGWPFTRWARRFRADPLRRLHLGGGSTGRTSLPTPAGVQTAAVSTALRDAVDSASGDLQDPWPRLAREAVNKHEPDLRDELDQAVRSADPGAWREPMWWRAVGGLQAALAVAALAGALWLLALFGFSYLRLPDPPTPEFEGFPYPTLLLVGGIVLGLVVAAVSRGVASIGAKRRAQAARGRMLEGVSDVVDRRVVAPLQDELATLDALRDQLAIAGAAR